MKCIYAIRHKESGRNYVGQTKSLKSRWATHVSYLNSGTHSNQYLQRAWSKHGEEAFELIVLEIVESSLFEREQYWMDKLDALDKSKGFNIQPAIFTDGRKRVFSEEHRRRISEAKRGKPRSPETIEKMRAAMKGKKWTEARHQKMAGRFAGEANPVAKLTWEKVREIRKLLAVGERSKAAIAREYDVDPSLIYLISANKSWKIENDPLGGLVSHA